MRCLSILSFVFLFSLTGCEFVVSPGGPGFSDGWVYGIQIVDDTTFSSVNNGDGYADAGEEIRLNIDLHNVTLIDTTDVVATLRSLHPCATVNGSEDTVNYWTLYSGEVSTGASSFTVFLSQNCANTSYVEFELIIESFDFFPWVEIISIPVHAVSGANIEIEDVILDDSTIYSSINNGDGSANPGEKVRLEVGVRNTGVTSAQGVTATLVSESSCANVSGLNDTINFYDVDPGQPKMGTGQLEVQLSLTCVPGTDVALTLYIEDNNLGAWSEVIIIPVEASMANLEITDVEITEESWMSLENNGDGYPNPGEEFELELTVTNYGNSDAQNVVGTLVTSTACASVGGSDDTVNFYDIDVNESKIGADVFRVTLSYACEGISYADFTLYLEDNMGNIWEQTFSVEVN